MCLRKKFLGSKTVHFNNLRKKRNAPLFGKLCHCRPILGICSSTRGLPDNQKWAFRDGRTDTHTDIARVEGLLSTGPTPYGYPEVLNLNEVLKKKTTFHKGAKTKLEEENVISQFQTSVNTPKNI